MKINVLTAPTPIVSFSRLQVVRFGNTDPVPTNPPATDAPAEEAQPQSKWKKRLKKYGPWAIVFFTVKGIITSTALGGMIWAAVTQIPGCNNNKPDAKPATQQVQPKDRDVKTP
jgi:hypothetical protein